MITIIDNGLGNISSIANMLTRLGIEFNRLKEPSIELVSNKIILPGIGAFDYGMQYLRESGWDKAVANAVDNGAFVLGICLGMQLLFDESEEGETKGLGLISGKVVKFKVNDDSLKIPHMGWNNVKPVTGALLFKGDASQEYRFYHVHSYHAVCADPKDVAGYTHYGYDFASVVQKGKVLGVQFHPEKSHKYGMNLFSNFNRL